MTRANLWRVVKTVRLLDPTNVLGTSSSIVRTTDILQVCAVVASREIQSSVQRIHMETRVPTTGQAFCHTLAATRATHMKKNSAELAVAGELARCKSIFALSTLFAVAGSIACVVCAAKLLLAAGYGPALPPAPPPPPSHPTATMVWEAARLVWWPWTW